MATKIDGREPQPELRPGVPLRTGAGPSAASPRAPLLLGGGEQRGRRSWDWAAGLALAGAAAATRIPLAGRSLGEADCARYLVGMEQWLRRGAGAPFIYAKVLSPGYYSLAAGLTRATGASPLELLNRISVAAAILSAPLLYLLGCRLTSRPVALAAAVLFLLAPGFWWLGIEPHPQGASFLCFLLALGCFLQDGRGRGGAARPAAAGPERGRGWGVAAALWLGAGMLLKCDLILLGGVFPALRWRQEGWSWRWARSWLIPAGGLGVFLLGQRLLLPLGWGQSHQQTQAAVLDFLSLPRGVEAIKQVLPMLTAYGVATLGLALTGIAAASLARGTWAEGWRRRWTWPLAAWVLPGTIFWLLMRGNNTRHMVPYLLLPLWAGLESLAHFLAAAPRLPRRGWRRAGHAGWRWAALCLAVIGANWVLVPASSNISLYPSGNVPASQRDLAARLAEMNGWMQAKMRGGAAPCFLGNYTLPYMELRLLQEHPGSRLEQQAAFASWPNDARQLGTVASFIEVNSPAEYVAAAARCQPAASLEYTARGLHERFIGEEWRAVPLARRWFPGGSEHPAP